MRHRREALPPAVDRGRTSWRCRRHADARVHPVASRCRRRAGRTHRGHERAAAFLCARARVASGCSRSWRGNRSCRGRGSRHGRRRSRRGRGRSRSRGRVGAAACREADDERRRESEDERYDQVLLHGASLAFFRAARHALLADSPPRAARGARVSRRSSPSASPTLSRGRVRSRARVARGQARRRRSPAATRASPHEQRDSNRCRPDSNRCMKVLQTFA